MKKVSISLFALLAIVFSVASAFTSTSKGKLVTTFYANVNHVAGTLQLSDFEKVGQTQPTSENCPTPDNIICYGERPNDEGTNPDEAPTSIVDGTWEQQ